jgi:hypothetical protein
MPTSRETVVYTVKLEGTQRFKQEARETALATERMKTAARTASIPVGLSEKDIALQRRMTAVQAEAGAAQARLAQRRMALEAQMAAAAGGARRRPVFGERGRAIATAAGAGRFAGLAAPFGGWGPLLAIGAGFTAVNQIKQGIANFGLNQQLAAQTKAGIASTGGAAHVTAKHIDELTQSLSKLAGVQDESVHDAENILLTFANIRNEVGSDNKIFDQASLAVQDLAARMHTSAPQAALQLGKALNDPVKGVGALRRVGVQFTNQQVDMIKVLIASGNRLGAQKIILRELNREFGGSAEAAGKTLPASLTRLSEAWEDARNRMLIKSLPYMIRFTDWLTKELPGAIDTALTAISLFDTDPKANALSRWVHRSFGGSAGRTFDYLLTHSGRDIIKDADKGSGGLLSKITPHPLSLINPIQKAVSRDLFGYGSMSRVREIQMAQAAEAGKASYWTPPEGSPLPRAFGGKGLGSATPFSQNDVRVHWDNPYPLNDRPIIINLDGKKIAEVTTKAQQKRAHAEGRGSAHKP